MLSLKTESLGGHLLGSSFYLLGHPAGTDWVESKIYLKN